MDGEWVEAGKTRAFRDEGFQPGDVPPNAFDKGNRVGVVHGAYSDQEIAPRAAALVERVLADPQMPDHLRSPAFRFALDAWAQVETAAAMFLEYISKQSFSEMVTPRLGGTKTQMEQWKSFMMAAAKMRSDLGISPASYARLAKDLGLAHKANEDALERLATAGAEITSRRLELEGGDAPA